MIQTSGGEQGRDRLGQKGTGLVRKAGEKGERGGCTKRLGTGRSSGEGNYATMLNILQSKKG